MTIFVYESCCALGLGREPGHPAHSLYREGRAMRDALTVDLQAIHGVEVRTLDDVPPDEEPSHFRDLATRCNQAIVIAPELDNELFSRCAIVEESGGRLLGPDSLAVARASSKLALARTWQRHGIPSPRTWSWNDRHRVPYCFPVVLKPDRGAGSTATYRIDTPGDLGRCLQEAATAGFADDQLIMQDFCPGQPASIAFLIGPSAIVPLAPTFQLLSTDGRFRYLGGELPIRPDLAERATALGLRAVECVPGLRGYVGVDLILGESESGSQDVAIEMNPRLTTSYVGLRRLADFNLADAMLRVANGQPIARPCWHPGLVRFRADGQAVRESGQAA